MVYPEEGALVDFEGLYQFGSFVRRDVSKLYECMGIEFVADTVKNILIRYGQSLMRFLPGNESFGREAVEIAQSYPSETDTLLMNIDGLSDAKKLGEREVEAEAVTEQEVVQERETLIERELDIRRTWPRAYTPAVLTLTQIRSLKADYMLPIGDLLRTPGLTDVEQIGSKFFSEKIYATANFIRTIDGISSGLPFSNNIRDGYRKFPFLVYMFRKRVDGEPRLYSVLLTAEDSLVVNPLNPDGEAFDQKSSGADQSPETGILVALNGSPLLAERHYQCPAYADFVEAYIRRTADYMDGEGCGHLAQILLFAGNFEMIMRYEGLRDCLAKRILTHRESFDLFMADPRNFWPDWKLSDLARTQFRKRILSLAHDGASETDKIALTDGKHQLDMSSDDDGSMAGDDV
jgi:hypothetical protein